MKIFLLDVLTGLIQPLPDGSKSPGCLQRNIPPYFILSKCDLTPSTTTPINKNPSRISAASPWKVLESPWEGTLKWPTLQQQASLIVFSCKEQGVCVLLIGLITFTTWGWFHLKMLLLCDVFHGSINQQWKSALLWYVKHIPCGEECEKSMKTELGEDILKSFHQ